VLEPYVLGSEVNNLIAEDGILSRLWWRNRRKARTKIPSTATVPITMPPMAPPLSEEEEDAAGLVVAVAVVVAVVVEGAEDTELLGKLGAAVLEFPLVPAAVKFTYAAQSGLGAASGQVGFWQME
jgi:hypothetical protein